MAKYGLHCSESNISNCLLSEDKTFLENYNDCLFSVEYKHNYLHDNMVDYGHYSPPVRVQVSKNLAFPQMCGYSQTRRHVVKPAY